MNINVDWKEVREILKHYYRNIGKIQKLQMKALNYQKDPETLQAIYKQIDKLSLVIEVCDSFLENKLGTKSATLLNLWCEGWTTKQMSQRFGLSAALAGHTISQSCKVIAKEVNSIESY